MTIDAITRKWIRNAADERAASRGCRMDETRGQHVLDFAANFLKLYEGDEYAGKPLIAHPWQVEATMRLFGWVKHSDRFRREVRRFREASIWISKKNFKSPTLAWWGLYLFCADGEPGQKVFYAAKDGNQAREIAGKHVLEMYWQCPELMQECELNKGTMQLTHRPSRSILKPISSADSKSQKAKEGLNGSILIDETHVVDREYISRISRAGISRSEPLMIEVSTAGDDPMCYGKERFDYGIAVNKGDIDDDAHLFIAYTAPQDLTDEALAADPVKYGKMANPAWGVTVNEEEFLQDYNRSKQTLATLADFKKYRLNIWQQTASPLIPMGEWALCRHDYTLKDLEGRICFGGLDLAKTRDTTSLFLVFPEDDGESASVWCHYWLPEATARKLANDVGYLEWAKQGWLTLTSGDVVDYQFVRQQVLDIQSQFDLRQIGYDGTYAAQLMQRLNEEDGMPLEYQVKFPQTIMNFAGPTAMLLRMVTAGTLRHPGNPLLTWQAGNVNAKTDANQNMRPIKPPFGDIRTIDGPVAGIMALEMWNRYGRAVAPSISVL